MATYVLAFDPTGKTHETFTVPAGKKVYLSRAPQVATGTATVQELLSLDNHILPDGVTQCDTGIAPGEQVSLAFMARSNNDINSVLVEVMNARPDVGRCT